MTASPSLIVPIEVSALVVSRGPVPYLRQGMDYAALADCKSPAPGPFSFGGDGAFASEAANQGVYVLWTLPAGLRRSGGAHGSSGGFPLVPNRWLVTRLLQLGDAASTAAPTATSWVVESDALGAGGSSAYLDPTSPTATPTRIGRRTEITAVKPWTEPTVVPVPFLTAVAEGNTAFAAFQPFNTDVFSIFDDLQTQGIEAASVSYTVTGWYADPATDVLASPTEPTPEAFAATLDGLGWSVTEATLQVATTSLYAGTANAVPWTPGVLPPSPAGAGEDAQVSVGSTSTDAVVAFTHAAMAQGGVPGDELSPEAAADLLSAFLYDLLPLLGQPGAHARLGAAIRDHWFESAGSGSRWVIKDASQDAGPDVAGARVSSEPGDASWLAALNDAQARFDQLSRELIAVQRDLFAMWWKKRAAAALGQAPWNVDPADFPPVIEALAQRASELLAAQSQAAALIPQGADAAELAAAIDAYASAHGLAPGRTLAAVAGSRFWAPVDPVLAISNTAHTMPLDPTEVVACRWPSQLVSALDVSAGGPAPVTISAEQAAAVMPAVPWTNLPAELPALAVEAFLLNPAMAAQLLGAAGAPVTDEAVQAARPSIEAAPVPPDCGEVPAIRSGYPWSPPWRPLFLDWKIAWYPIPFATAGQEHWTFDGTDYRMRDAVPAPTATVLQGRTVLTPTPAATLKARIDRYLLEAPQSAVAEELASVESQDAIAGWDFLSQRLSGLGAQLAGWAADPAEHPVGETTATGLPLGPLVGAGAAMPPAPSDAFPPPRTVKPKPSTFEGIRGGQFAITRLDIVDAFGQVREIVIDQTGPGQTVPITPSGQVFEPILAEGLTPAFPFGPRPARFAQLPPRILQPLRLNLDLVDGPSGGPIAGWIMPSHLDPALSAYLADGTALGALRLAVGTEGQPAVVWAPSPGSPLPALPLPAEAVGPLERMLAGIAAQGVGALQAALGAIDESLWSVEPVGAAGDGFLSVLVGRPLALVTTELSLELESAPWTTTSWPYTFIKPPPLMLDYAFDVHLGDADDPADGVVGYFAGGDYGTFHCAHLPDGSAGGAGYLQLIAPGAYPSLRLAAAAGPGPAVPVTLLVDPRSSVKARCGLVPTKRMTLPSPLVDGAMSSLTATFRAGPALVSLGGPAPDGTPAPVGLPTLAEQRGTASWLERSGPAGAWVRRSIAPATTSATPPDTAPTLREGLIEITGATT